MKKSSINIDISNRYKAKRNRIAEKVFIVNDEFIRPFGKKDLLSALVAGKPYNSMIQLVSGDADFSKMSLTERLDFISENKDVDEPELESNKE